MSKALDTQEGGDHYKSMSVQPWQAFESWLTLEQHQGYLLATATAYLARFNSQGLGKGGMQDVKKAIHTLQRMVEISEPTKHTPRVAAEPAPSAGWQGWWHCKDSTVKQAHYFNAARNAVCGVYPEIGHMKGMVETSPESVRDGVGFCKACQDAGTTTAMTTVRAWDGWFYNSKAVRGHQHQHHFKNSSKAVCGYAPATGDEMTAPLPYGPGPMRCAACNVMPMAPCAPEPGEATNFIPGQ